MPRDVRGQNILDELVQVDEIAIRLYFEMRAVFGDRPIGLCRLLRRLT